MRSYLYATTAIFVAMSVPAIAQEAQQQGQAGATAQQGADASQTAAAGGATGSLLHTQFGGRLTANFSELDADQSGGLTLDELLGEEGANVAENDRAILQQEFGQFAGDDDMLDETEFGTIGSSMTATADAGGQQQMQGQQQDQAQQQAAQPLAEGQDQAQQAAEAQPQQQAAEGEGQQANVTIITEPANQGETQAEMQTQTAAATPQAGGEIQVAEQCMTDMQAFGTEIYSGQAAGAVGREFESLRDAALTFARLGDEEACQMVLAEMRDIYTQRAEGFDPEAWRTGLSERAAQAVPVTQFGAMLSLDELQDMDVIGANGEDLGEIENIVVNPENGSIQYVLLSTGGWFNTNYVPIRFQDLRMTPEGNELVLPISEETLESAPTVDIETAYAGTDAWSGDVNTWWDQNVTQ